MIVRNDEEAMALALRLAARAARAGEVPVGAVVVDVDGRVLGRGWNRRESAHDPTAHAEILALRRAAQRRGAWRLSGTTLVVTLEPCPMCAGAAVNARVSRVVYGCADPKAGAARSLYELLDDPRLNHRAEIIRGVREAECAEALKRFFRNLRSERRSVGAKSRASRSAP